MAFLRRKTRNGAVYYSLVELRREKGRVRQKALKYFATLEEANSYARKHGVAGLPDEGLIDAKLAADLEEKLRRLRSMRPLPQATLRSLREKLAVEMTYNSNAIEGNTLTLKETKLVIMDGITVGGHPVREIFEAKNHKEAIGLMYGMAEAGRGIKEGDVLELHAAITHGTLPEGECGFYRRGQVYITGSKHRPPDWHKAPDLMKAKVYRELNSVAQGAKAVESAALVHFWTVDTHPFTDGNGRLARLLTSLRLIRAGFPPAITLMRERRRYYDALERGHVKGDLRPFANLVARTVSRALDLWLSAEKS